VSRSSEGSLKVASSKLVKTAAICGISAMASFIPAGITSSNASTTKTSKTSKTSKSTKTTIKKTGTFLGSATNTIYGAVQVSVTIKRGKITKVNAPIYPVGTFRDQQINSQAIPMLEQEVLKAQSSHINNISGASYTAQGFYISLVSALGKASLK
jgi:uncharacterized protein with FMN-binding domain